MLFCNDVDLLYWEPDVLKEAAFASQTIGVGAGAVSGTTFSMTSSSPTFIEQKVAPGQVIVLSGALAGCYAITGVTGAYVLEISALYDDLFPDSGPPPAPVGLGVASGLGYAIRTFFAQRKVVSDLLLQSVGIVPGSAQAQTAAVLNPSVLRRACVLGTLQMIYSAIAAAASEPAAFTVRAELYERLYRRSLLSAQVDLDLDGDGRADARRSPGLVRMVRG
jgi:hypothetical protein